MSEITSVSVWHFARSAARHKTRVVIENSSFMMVKSNAERKMHTLTGKQLCSCQCVHNVMTRRVKYFGKVKSVKVLTTRRTLVFVFCNYNVSLLTVISDYRD